MKLWERVIDRWLRKHIPISKNQFGFMSSRLAIEIIHLLTGLIELYRDRKKDLYMMVIDIEKVYDRVPREVLWRCLEKKKVSVSYIRVIKDMYKGVRMGVRTLGGNIIDFPLNIRLHELSSLSSFLFHIVMDELIKGIRDDAPWCIYGWYCSHQ